MPRAQYRPRPWKLRWNERNGEPRMQAYRWENGAKAQRDWLETNGYQNVTLTYEAPPAERPL